MTAPTFLPGSDTVRLFRVTPASDRYGGVVRDWANGDVQSEDVLGCALVPMSSAENMVAREYTEVTAVLFAPWGTAIDALDRVEWLGAGGILTYEVIGPPRNLVDDAGVPSHVEADLKAMAG